MILAHNYQAPEIQDVADHVGDSLALSRLAAASTARVIVFAGVYFMAETAKILAPDRTVLIPEPQAGCSLADTITAEQVREWKAEHPGAAVVAYVNTSAEVKAESDLCCTSANAAQVVASVPAGQEVLFLPDQFLGAHVRRVTGRANLHVWSGECHVHAGHQPGRAAPPGRRRTGRGAVHPPRVRLLDRRAVAGRSGRPAAGPDPGAVHRRHAGRRPHHHGAEGPGGHRDRHAAPAAPGQPRRAVGAGQPARGVPLHEDDHAGDACCAACARAPPR